MFIKRIFVSILAICIVSSCGTPDSDPEQAESNTEVIADQKFTLPALPEKVEFADKTIPLENFDVKERLDKELIVNTFYHSSTIQSFKRANRYFDQISSILKENDVPDDFKYLCLIESGLLQVTSPSGAKGFWQFMPETAKEYGLKVNAEIDERMHIAKSTIAACEYLKDANQKFDDWVLTAASYNRGVNGIKRDLENQYVDDYFDLHLNNETSRYVFRILALKIIFESPEEYGFDVSQMELYDSIKTKEIVVTESIEDLAIWSKKMGSNLRMLKLLNPWLKSNRLKIDSNQYTIELPE